MKRFSASVADEVWSSEGYEVTLFYFQACPFSVVICLTEDATRWISSHSIAYCPIIERVERNGTARGRRGACKRQDTQAKSLFYASSEAAKQQQELRLVLQRGSHLLIEMAAMKNTHTLEDELRLLTEGLDRQRQQHHPQLEDQLQPNSQLHPSLHEDKLQEAEELHHEEQRPQRDVHQQHQEQQEQQGDGLGALGELERRLLLPSESRWVAVAVKGGEAPSAPNILFVAACNEIGEAPTVAADRAAASSGTATVASLGEGNSSGSITTSISDLSDGSAVAAVATATTTANAAAPATTATAAKAASMRDAPMQKRLEDTAFSGSGSSKVHPHGCRLIAVEGVDAKGSTFCKATYFFHVEKGLWERRQVRWTSPSEAQRDEEEQQQAVLSEAWTYQPSSDVLYGFSSVSLRNRTCEDSSALFDLWMFSTSDKKWRAMQPSSLCGDRPHGDTGSLFSVGNAVLLHCPPPAASLDKSSLAYLSLWKLQWSRIALPGALSAAANTAAGPAAVFAACNQDYLFLLCGEQQLQEAHQQQGAHTTDEVHAAAAAAAGDAATAAEERHEKASRNANGNTQKPGRCPKASPAAGRVFRLPLASLKQQSLALRAASAAVQTPASAAAAASPPPLAPPAPAVTLGTEEEARGSGEESAIQPQHQQQQQEQQQQAQQVRQCLPLLLRQKEGQAAQPSCNEGDERGKVRSHDRPLQQLLQYQQWQQQEEQHPQPMDLLQQLASLQRTQQFVPLLLLTSSSTNNNYSSNKIDANEIL
ncbi:hypothetical protein cyc_08617 [Cyclospora cayetanensis]|uniref:Uncharacterized protein n=1 Tax=Cyclospora cayetanensis TaxID=88456 RepID=A0A1D3D6L3_9EIME|nr:hypothetical protein cyc_08617 [Cyclospora cayetanensis]